MTTYRTFPQLPKLGQLTIDEGMRSDGDVIFELSAAQVIGCVVVRPHIRHDQAVPDRVVIQLGTGRHLLADHLTNLPVIGTTTLIGGADHVDVDDSNWAERLILRQPATRARPKARTEPTAATSNIMRTIIGLVVERYRTFDKAPLMLAAARSSADRRLAACVHHEILPHLHAQREAGAGLADAQQLADKLQQLSPLALIASPSAQIAHARFDPDVYVSADDDGDWLTCHLCDKPTVMITSGASLGALWHSHTHHRCLPAAI